MRITVSHIPPDGLTVRFTKNAEFFPVLNELVESGEAAFTAPIDAVITARVVSGNVVEVSGDITTTLLMDCGRCLETVEQPMTRPFSIDFVHQENALNPLMDDEDGFEVRDEDIETESYTGDVIELKNTIQEQVVLGIPMQFVCSDTCKGLCPGCGVNRNRESCSCDTVVSHPAFAALKKLKT